MAWNCVRLARTQSHLTDVCVGKKDELCVLVKLDGRVYKQNQKQQTVNSIKCVNCPNKHDKH